MAIDGIGIGHGAGEVAGTLMSSGTKRRVEELGEHVTTTVVGGVVEWSMSAWVARYEARTSVDDKLDRLRALSIMVHSAVEAAEGVHIRSWWLRRWLWKLRDAAFDGDEVLRLFRHRRTAEETGAASRQASGNMVWRALRSVKSVVFGRGDDGTGVERLSRVVARLEREAIGLGDFLKMLELEIRRSSPPVLRPARPVKSATPVQVPPFGLLEPDHHTGGALAVLDVDRDEVLPVNDSDYWAAVERPGVVQQSLGAAAAASRVSPPSRRIQQCRLESEDEDNICYDSASPDAGDGSRLDHGLSSISHEEYVAGVRKMVLLILRRRILRVLDRLIRKKPAAAPAASSALTPADTERLRELVASIRLAAILPSTTGSAYMDFHRKRSWLARWRKQLLNMAFRVEYQLLVVSLAEDGADASGLMRWTAQNVETATAHLEDFATLAGFALASLDRPSAPY